MALLLYGHDSPEWPAAGLEYLANPMHFDECGTAGDRRSEPSLPLLPPVRVRLLATRRYINGGDPWCFRLSIVLRQQGPPPGRLTEWTLLVQNLPQPTLAILSTEVSMPISDDDARAKRIRDIAEVLARGLDRLSHARESSEEILARYLELSRQTVLSVLHVG